MMAPPTTLIPQQNPYAAPRVPTEGQPDGVDPNVDLDQQLERTQVTILVKIAIVAVAISGALLLFGGLQLWGATMLLGAWRVVPWAMLVVGLFQLVLSVKIYRQRVWASLSATLICGLVTLATMAWFVISITSGFISLLALMIPFAQGAAAVLSGLAIPSCRRAAAARRNLAAGGLDVDF